MIDGLPLVLTAATALGCAVAAGALLAFSTFVMGALGRLPAHEGILAMQSINRRAVTPAFMALLFAPALASAGVVALGLARRGEAYGPWLIAGGALYLVGVILVTIGVNVPRNDALARLDPSASDARTRWERYRREWTAANHVRGLAGVGAAAALVTALCVG